MKPRVPAELQRQLPDGRQEHVRVLDPAWIVTYQGRPVSVARIPGSVNFSQPRYVSTVYSQQGSAIRAAERLNRLYDSDQFSVLEIKWAE